MKEELPPDDFDVLESAVERYEDLSARLITSVLVGRSFGPMGRNLSLYQPLWGKMKRAKLNVTVEDVTNALCSPDPASVGAVHVESSLPGA
jgi:hypothetical protein